MLRRLFPQPLPFPRVVKLHSIKVSFLVHSYGSLSLDQFRCAQCVIMLEIYICVKTGAGTSIQYEKSGQMNDTSGR